MNHTKTMLSAMCDDPNLSDAFKAVIKPTWYRPMCGRWGRVYQSQADADSYDAGWAAWPDAPAFDSPSGPVWDGFNDRDADVIERDEMRAEAARGARERD